MVKNILFTLTFLILLTSCEEVIQIDLNSANPAFVVEAKIQHDSVAQVRLTRTTSYFSQERPGFIDNAKVYLSDGSSREELIYQENGNYKGDTLTGIQNRSYTIEILHDGKTYQGVSTLPAKTEIISIRYFKGETPTILNPNGEIVYTIQFEFVDDPEVSNFYMVSFVREGKMIENRYFLFTENITNGGSLEKFGGNIFSFAESIFTTEGEVTVNLFSIDEPVYNYFMRLDDVLFWKRRVMPPTPYNPVSNVDNGALGYFAAWGLDTKRVLLE